MRIPRSVLALAVAGALATGAAVAASAHQLSGTISFDDESASAPRVEQPEPSPEASDDATIPVVVAPEPTETPEAPEPAETPEAASTGEPAEESHEAAAAQQHEHEDETRNAAVPEPARTPETEGDDSSTGRD